MRLIVAGSIAGVVCVATLALSSSLPIGRPRAADHSTRIRLDREADLVVSVPCDDQPQADGRHSAAAFTIAVDGKPVEEILIFPGSGRREYDAIVGPLARGSHTITLGPSRHWRWPPPPVGPMRVRVVKGDDEDARLIRHAPALWARADTIGTANDLPLLMYVERRPDSNGATTLAYSMIFSNEDGGTATRALMARWGRTTDIEWAYSVRLERGAVTDETFQGPTHDTRAFKGPRIGPHPILLVATMNNLFTDHGVGVVMVRPVPRVVDLARATRESVMDLEPWTYLVMAHELRAEGKVVDGGGSTMTVVDDPRRYVYLEAQLELRGTTAAGSVQTSDGASHTSHGDAADLRIDRSGWVRIAVPVGDASPTAIGWSCERAPRPKPGEGTPSCRINATRAFRLGSRYEVGPNLIERATLTLVPGDLRTIQTMTSR